MRIGQTSALHFLSQLTTTVVGFVATVYFARTLGADVLGSYFLTVALLGWLRIGTTMGIGPAVEKRVSEGDDEGEHLVAGVVAQVALLAFGVAAVLVFADQVDAYIGAPVAEMIATLLVVVALWTFVSAVLRGEHRVHVAGWLSPLDRTLRSLLQIGAVAMGFGLFGMLVGYGVAAVVACLAGLVFISTRPQLPTRKHFDSIRTFAQYSWLSNVEGQTFRWLDTIVLGFFVSSSFVAYYEVAWNVASVFAIFGGSIRQSLFPEISQVSKVEDWERVSGLISDSVRYSGLFLIPGLVGSLLVGDVVLTVYGQSFAEGYTVLVILVLARLFYAYKDQLTNTLNAINQPAIAFRINLGFIVINLILNIALVATFGWVGAAIGTTVASVLALGASYVAISRTIAFVMPIAELGRQVISATAMGVVVFAGRAVLGDSLLAVICLVVIGSVVYFLVLLGISTELRGTVKDNLPSRLST